MSEEELAQAGPRLRTVCTWSAATGAWQLQDDPQPRGPLRVWHIMGLSGEYFQGHCTVQHVQGDTRAQRCLSTSAGFIAAFPSAGTYG
jgi:hypothetical protein